MNDHRARSRIDLPFVLAVSLAGLGLLWIPLSLPEPSEAEAVGMDATSRTAGVPA